MNNMSPNYFCVITAYEKDEEEELPTPLFKNLLLPIKETKITSIIKVKQLWVASFLDAASQRQAVYKNDNTLPHNNS